MSLRRYKMFASITTTANAIDSCQFQRAGVLKQIIFNYLFDSVTDNATVRAQVSRAPTSDVSAAAAGTALLTQSIGMLFIQGNFVTSGLSQVPGNLVVECNDKISIGDLLYVNAVAAGTVTCSCDVTLVIDE